MKRLATILSGRRRKDSSASKNHYENDENEGVVTEYTQLRKKKVQDKLANEFERLQREESESLKKLENFIAALYEGSEENVSKVKLQSKLRELLGDKIAPTNIMRMTDMMDADRDWDVSKSDAIVTLFALTTIDINPVERIYRMYALGDKQCLSREDFALLIEMFVLTDFDDFMANIPFAQPALLEYLKSVQCDELLLYLMDFQKLEDIYIDDLFPLSKANELYSKYIIETSPTYLNLTADVYDNIQRSISQATDDSVSMEGFRKAAEQARRLLRFNWSVEYVKSGVRGSKSRFSELTWQKMQLKKSDTMDLKTFKKWHELSPGIFDFVDEVGKKLHKIIFE